MGLIVLLLLYIWMIVVPLMDRMGVVKVRYTILHRGRVLQVYPYTRIIVYTVDVVFVMVLVAGAGGWSTFTGGMEKFVFLGSAVVVYVHILKYHKYFARITVLNRFILVSVVSVLLVKFLFF